MPWPYCSHGLPPKLKVVLCDFQSLYLDVWKGPLIISKHACKPSAGTEYPTER